VGGGDAVVSVLGCWDAKIEWRVGYFTRNRRYHPQRDRHGLPLKRGRGHQRECGGEAVGSFGPDMLNDKIECGWGIFTPNRRYHRTQIVLPTH